MTDDHREERYDRMVRTPWIDIRKIHGKRISVIGAGALGNEVVKDLVLAGFRIISVIDPDVVEESNLSRCVLFRRGNIGECKAEVVSRSAKELDPDCIVSAYPLKVQSFDISQSEIVIGCLDNVSARLHVNAHTRYFGIPYIDGATDGFRGKVQVSVSPGPCLECGMNRTHLNELHRTFSCDPGNEVPVKDPVILSSGITTSSIIAAMCVREAIKIACDRSDLCIKGICHYDGISGASEILDNQIRPGCPHHGELL